MENIFENIIKKDKFDITHEEKIKLNEWLIKRLGLKEFINLLVNINSEVEIFLDESYDEKIISGEFNNICSQISLAIDDAISSILFEKQFNCFYNEFLKILNEEEYDEIIVFHASFGWNIEMKQRPQHLAEALSKKKILYIYRSDIKNDDLFSIEKIQENLYLVNLDMYSLNSAFFEAIKAIEKPRFVHVYATCLNFVGYDLIKSYIDKGFNVIYDFVDELSSDISGYEVTSDMLNGHNKLLSDKENVFVISTAEVLKDKVDTIRGENKNILVPNGVNLDDFISIKNRGFEWKDKNNLNVESFGVDFDNNIRESDFGKQEKFQFILNKKKPIIGYYGALAKWFDYDLIIRLAKEREEYEIVLIGMDYDGSYDKSGLDKYHNISYLGIVNYDELINYSIHFDVCIVPFIKNDITDSTSPIKIFEYMALGKPIVTTNIRECLKYKSCIVSKNSNEFIENIDRALNELRFSEEYINIVRGEALNNTWDSRAEKIKRCLEE